MVFITILTGYIQKANATIPFTRGINLTMWYMTTSASQIQFSTYTSKDFDNIKSLGCDVIRLPVDFYSMNSGSPNYTLTPLLLTYLDQTVTLAESKQMYLILDCQPENCEVACANPNLETILTKVWTQLATRYKDRSMYIIYEILNEPNTYTTSVWGQIQQRVINAIRTADTRHKIVVAPSYWGTTLEMSQLPVYTDTNLIYTFHFYEPGIFTHQGITWYEPSLGSVQNVPFPYNAATMPPLPAGIKGTYWEDEYNNYKNTGNVAKIQETIAKAVTFKNSRNVDMYCGEFGAYNEYTPADSRNYYYSEIRKYLEANGIAWTTWDYSYGFGIFLPFSQARFEYDLNKPMLTALGLKIPGEVDPTMKPDLVGFKIYTDNSAYIGTGQTMNFSSTNKPNNGTFCINWTGAAQYEGIYFNFNPDKDLSTLKANNYALSLLVRGDTPGTNITLRFIDTKTNTTDDHPWRMDYIIDQSKAKLDGYWHKLYIPLSQFVDAGAWDESNSTWYAASGKFNWKAVDRFQIVTDEGSLLNKNFWFDNIIVANMDTAQIYETKSINDPNTGNSDINSDNSASIKVFPNPVNNSAIISYTLVNKENVDISIYNLTGQKVKSILSAGQPAGHYSVNWDTDNNNGRKVQGGIYICRISISGKVNGLKIVVL